MQLSAIPEFKQPIRLFAAIVLAGGIGSTAAATERVRVEFDAGTLVGCRDVTTDEFAAAYPGFKLVEAKFRLSMRVVGGDVADLSEISVEINSPKRRLRVIDFLPKTLLESETVGPIEITTTKEKNRALGLNAAGTASLPTLVIPNQLTPSTNLGSNHRDVVVEKRQQVSPHEVTLASGTINQEHGVFFALRPSESFSLEGHHQFTLQMSVPRGWRGDWIDFRCRAKCESKNYFSTSEPTCGQIRRMVALFAEGDADAQSVAQRAAQLQGWPVEPQRDDGSLVDELLAAPKASVEFSRLALTYPLRWAKRSERTANKPSLSAATRKEAVAKKPRAERLDGLLEELAALAAAESSLSEPQAKLD